MMLSSRVYPSTYRRVLVVACLVAIVYFIGTNMVPPHQDTVDTRHSQHDQVPEVESSLPSDASRLPPCGEICSYGGKFIKKGILYPQLRKAINCDNIMKRMAYRDHPVVYPPPEAPPDSMLSEFTMNGGMPIAQQWYLNENWTAAPRVYDEIFVKMIIEKLQTGVNVNMYDDGICVQDTLKHYRKELKDKHGVVIGTEMPWLEAILLGYGAGHVTTLEYAELIMEHPQLSTYTPYDFADDYLRGAVEEYDFAASFSSIEHSGLGRYTDPLNPYGDLEAMAQVYCMVKPGGMFAVGVPYAANNSDYIAWNAHRMYGTRRLKHLTANWEVLETAQCADIFNHKFVILRKPE